MCHEVMKRVKGADVKRREKCVYCSQISDYSEACWVFCCRVDTLDSSMIVVVVVVVVVV